MRLTSIKLAGFKSFVEPTQIAVPGQLVGVVGPNGCGKSNVVDAVRWVLGESQAKHLRGEHLADVIFNGSAERPALGRASVELSFDNTLGRAAGAWSQYAEISVKRAMNRDGESSYTINGQHVRRKDVQDIFLGTGLGPRAYAIIEQGMISRIITAKPEEIRIYLEEAAAVSKYRERRKETEARLKDSRENLARVSDIRGELGTQIEKLAEQAAVAEKYQALAGELKLTQHLLAYSRSRDAAASRERAARDIERTQLAIDEEGAKLTQAQSQLDAARQSHYHLTDALSQAQGGLYEANAEVARLEREREYVSESRRRVSAQLSTLAEQMAENDRQRDDGLRQHGTWQDELSKAAVRIVAAVAAVETEHAAVPAMDAALGEAQATERAKEAEMREVEQALSADEMRESQALKVIGQLEARKNRLKQEQMSLAVTEERELAALDARRAEAATQTQRSNDEARALDEQLHGLEESRRINSTQSAEAHRELARIEAELSARRAQQAKLEANQKLAVWASRHGLDRAPRLWQHLKIEQGWEDALEAVLGVRLNAVEVDDAAKLAAALDDPPPAALALIRDQTARAATSSAQPPKPLRALVRGASARVERYLDEALAGIGVTEAGAAIDWKTLPAGVLLVDRAGTLHSPASVVFHGPQSELHGVLQRQREIEELESARGPAAERCGALDTQASTLEEQRRAALDRQRTLQTQSQELRDRVAALEVELAKKREANAAADQRKLAIREELAHIESDFAHENEVLQAAQAGLAQASDRVQVVVDQLEALTRARKQAEAALAARRDAIVKAERAVQEARFLERQCQDKIAGFSALAENLVKRNETLAGTQAALQAELAGLTDDALKTSLEAALSLRAERETALAQAKHAVESVVGNLSALDEARLKCEQALQPLRDKLNELRLKEQEARTLEAQFLQQLEEDGVNVAELAEQLTKKTRSSNLQSEINRLQGEIEALGAVNLAALQELTAARERKDFLDRQAADLTEAVETLEAAIKRIDRETRERLKETFEAVNKHFGELFKTLFRGGNAALKLTGEEILDAGVEVIAQPPGKKAASINMLSGGEKALTALALVFAMFKLNPAPFCVLDEVDAPLDETNTGRMCDLVKSMSDATQFVVITHNKTTMEIAEQLIGITMPEAGVSRVVEVDVQSAMRLAEQRAAA